MFLQIFMFKNLNTYSKLGYKIQRQKEASRTNDGKWRREKGHELHF